MNALRHWANRQRRLKKLVADISPVLYNRRIKFALALAGFDSAKLGIHSTVKDVDKGWYACVACAGEPLDKDGEDRALSCIRKAVNEWASLRGAPTDALDHYYPDDPLEHAERIRANLGARQVAVYVLESEGDKLIAGKVMIGRPMMPHYRAHTDMAARFDEVEEVERYVRQAIALYRVGGEPTPPKAGW